MARCCGVPTPLLLRQRHKFRDRVHRDLWRDSHRHRREAQHRDRREILGDVEWDVLIERLVDGDAAGGERQRVAVRRRHGSELGADVAARAAAVLDNDRLAPCLGELLREQPSDLVGAAARRERDDETEAVIRKALRRCVP
jgi:hypothetical protein